MYVVTHVEWESSPSEPGSQVDLAWRGLLEVPAPTPVPAVDESPRGTASMVSDSESWVDSIEWESGSQGDPAWVLLEVPPPTRVLPVDESSKKAAFFPSLLSNNESWADSDGEEFVYDGYFHVR